MEFTTESQLVRFDGVWKGRAVFWGAAYLG